MKKIIKTLSNDWPTYLHTGIYKNKLKNLIWTSKNHQYIFWGRSDLVLDLHCVQMGCGWNDLLPKITKSGSMTAEC